MSSNIIGFIPSRYESTRFPGKPLVKIGGKTMIQRVYEQAIKSKLLSEVVVLTDDKRIYSHVSSFGNVEMTSPKCINGTQRIMSVIDNYHPEYIDGFVNIQGDEPFVSPEQIDSVCLGILHGNDITTLKYKTSIKDIDSNNVKVVCSNRDKALYFSRNHIPYNSEEIFIHIGIYGFNKRIVDKLKNNMSSFYKIDIAEKLEQLSWMANEIDIYAYNTRHKTIGIDTPEDLKRVERILELKEAGINHPSLKLIT